jgi:hypothetical protein
MIFWHLGAAEQMQTPIDDTPAMPPVYPQVVTPEYRVYPPVQLRPNYPDRDERERYPRRDEQRR